MNQIEKIAAENQQKAWDIIRDTGVIDIWHTAGATVNLVGSLKTGLLVKHRDIDFHIYTEKVAVPDDFVVMSRLAKHPRIRQVQYANLLDTDEQCLEWHAWYEDDSQKLWQLDMIHMVKGSRYDGYFEKVAERITTTLNDETRQALLRLKYETPETEKIMGIVYYHAVLAGGVRTYDGFREWIRNNPVAGVLEWMP